MILDKAWAFELAADSLAPDPWAGWAPQAAVGHACCNDCAKGKKCAGKKCSVGALPYPDWSHAVARVGARALPFSYAEDLDAQVIKLSVDVNAWAEGKLGGPIGDLSTLDEVKATAAKFPNKSDAEFWIDFLTFRLDWISFFTERRDNPPPWYTPFPSIAMTDGYGDLPKYDALFARYQELIARFKKLGGKTEAEIPDQSSPVEKAAEEAGKGFGEAAHALTKIGTYLAVGGVVILGLYVLAPIAGPALGRLVMKRRRR